MIMAKHRMRVCVEYKDDGSPIVKQICANSELEMADKVVKTILQSERSGEFVKETAPIPKPKAPTFKAYTEDWHATYKAQRIKLTTDGYYRTLLDRHLYPAWENTPINEITTKTIQTYLNGKKDMAAKSLQEMLIFMRAILESARKDGIIQSNPADDKRIVVPSTKKTVREALPLEDIREIILSLHKLEPLDACYMALLLFTGMRRGEVLGLKWKDVDFEKNTIHVERNVVFPKGSNNPVVGTPKTESGTRYIPIAPELREYLKPQDAEDFVIGGSEPITLSVHRRMMERIGRRIDLHGASPHIFRHSYATMLNDAGVPIKTIQGIIGHADLQTTANRYIHGREEKKQEAVLSVSRLLAI